MVDTIINITFFVTYILAGVVHYKKIWKLYNLYLKKFISKRKMVIVAIFLSVFWPLSLMAIGVTALDEFEKIRGEEDDDCNS